VRHDQQSWAVALWVEKKHGDKAPRYIAEQIGRMALEGDAAGMARWRQVARCYEALGAGHRTDG